MVKMWVDVVMEYGNWDSIRRGLWSKCGTMRLWNMGNGTTLDVAYGQKVGCCGCRIREKWDNIRHGLWSKCGTMRLWNMGNGTTLDVSYGQNVGQDGYKIWKMGQH